MDDGISGTTFDRPGVQRLLDDAKAGNINLILCKDMSRFGRNYIMVGQYVDYIFPMYNIRFIALTDNIDTLNSDSASMDMLPIMNVFNEWHAANTSKKLRTVFLSNAKAGKYMTTASSYGYVKGDDDNYTPQIDPEAAAVVLRIFKMRASGMGHKSIADVLNQEHIVPPLDYRYEKLGKPVPVYSRHLWQAQTVKRLLEGAILQDIQRQLDFVTNDAEAREKYLARKQGDIAHKNAEDSKRKRDIEKRIDDLSKLIRKLYEDRVLGNMPEKTCAELLTDYQQEKETLQAELDEIMKRSETIKQDEADVDEYIRRLKRYAGVTQLTRQMAMDLLEYVTIDRYEGEGKPRSIHIYYKLIDKPLRDKNNALA